MIVQKCTTVIFLEHNQSGPGDSVQVWDLALVAFYHSVYMQTVMSSIY